MPVVEITQLRLKGMEVDDPALLENLSQVRSKLQTNSRFFSCIEVSSLIYIFGVWPSLDAHLEFLASPARDEVLGPQEAILEFQWTIHLELDTFSPLLFDAPFLALERFGLDAADVGAFSQILEDHTRNLQTNDDLAVTYAWRCDLPAGSSEAAILTGWGSKSDGVTDAGKRRGAFNGTDGGSFRAILFHSARNLEHAQSRA